MRRIHRYKTEQKTARRQQIIAAADCPRCGAIAGDRCVGPSGLRATPHRERSAATPKQSVVPIQTGISTDSKIHEVLEEGARVAAEAVRQTYEWGAGRCQSPIERLMLAQFAHPDTGNNWDTRCSVLMPPSASIEHVQPPPMEGFFLWPQIEIGPYRVDFMFAAVRGDGSVSFAIIECDGHDFHERTKEQAQRDKARDRYLIGKGFRVLRFTGSEIYRNPEAVWDEIIKIVLGLCD